MSQPDDKMVDMTQDDSSSSCGCLGVQYAKEVLKWPDFRGCGFTVFLSDENDSPRLVDGIGQFDMTKLAPDPDRTFSYAAIKAHIRENYAYTLK